MRLNLALLMVVAFLPFPTGVMGDAITVSRHAERAAVVVYGVTLLVTSLLGRALWHHVASDRGLLHDDVADSIIAGVDRRQWPRVGLLAAAIVVGVLLLPRLAVFAYLAVALESVAHARGDRELGRTQHREP